MSEYVVVREEERVEKCSRCDADGKVDFVMRFRDITNGGWVVVGRTRGRCDCEYGWWMEKQEQQWSGTSRIRGLIRSWRRPFRLGNSGIWVNSRVGECDRDKGYRECEVWATVRCCGRGYSTSAIAVHPESGYVLDCKIAKHCVKFIVSRFRIGI